MTTSLTLDGIKAKQQKTWASGDYGAVAALIHPISEATVQAADLSAGSRVLDVATGTGNAAIAAARCRCEVTAVDYVTDLMDRGRARAEAEHLTVTFREADAERLPYDDGEYDAVLSVVGVMFAPDQERAAAELLRVLRPGGTLALANWTPDGFIGHLFRTVGRHVPPPPGVRPPAEWGTEARLRELLGDRVTGLRVTRRDFVFRFGAATEFADFFRANYGPTRKAFEALDEHAGTLLYDDLVDLADRHNAATDGTVKIPASYVEALAYRV
ncbi:class I SAM-dependent methyltransferase [Micromonospora endolithica]|uniref:Class I SAM-dependent methyltransferase n=1 Tax=Micromonospora endolithica TaxID=230091 RepID=A0A3A9ZAN7_9ACTN|nr:class I SAM-dependent methyltransferase [Micromonospora endolithica]RKN45358.1 class I SAM-dependent methyltransferase [Micromonospora endolithica]TWJ22937.1 methyltransferase family protein [Micromonospora endolithica]